MAAVQLPLHHQRSTRVVVALTSGVEIRRWREVRERYPELRRRFTADLVVANPAFAEAERMERSTFGIDPHIHCYDWDLEADVLTVPHGFLPVIREACRAGVEVVDRRLDGSPRPRESRIELREYQRPAVDALMSALRHSGLGLLVADPGSGKTEIALEIIARLGLPALFVTHTAELAQQAANRAVSRLGLDPGVIGMIGGGKQEIGRPLTVGLVQSLAKMPPEELACRFPVLIVDEVHHTGGAPTWQGVVSRLPSRYRLGLTATLERRDGLECITKLYFGPPTYRIDMAQVSGGALVPRLEVVKTAAVPEAWSHWQSYGDGIMPFGAILTELLEDDERNAEIVQLLLRITPGRHTLVLSQRVKHCEALARLLLEEDPTLQDEVAVIHGGQRKSLRQEIVERARAGDVRTLFSVAIAKEGLDVPVLDQLVLAGGGKDPTYIKQAIGRIQRRHPGKSGCVVWDVVDERCGVMQAQHWARRPIYRELGMIKPRRRGGGGSS